MFRKLFAAVAIALGLISAPLAGGSTAPLVIIGTPPIGGSASGLLYTNSSALLVNSATLPFQTTITPAANTSGLVVSGVSLTGSNTQPILDLSGTWNTSGIATGLKLNITNTASNASSLLMDLQVGAVSQLAVTRVGGLIFGGSNAFVINGSTGTIDIRKAGATVYLGNSSFFVGTGGTALNSTSFFGWDAASAGSGAVDLSLYRAAANTLAQRNGTTAQKFRVYGSWTDASNGDWLEASKAAGGGAYLRTDKNGTGVASTLSLGTGGANQLVLSTAGLLAFGATLANTVPALKPNGATLEVRKGDDSAYASLTAVEFLAGSGTGFFAWNGRSLLRSPSDGVVTFTNFAETDFTRVQFGGTTSSFPALKRSSTVLQARLADDSAYAPFEANTLRTATAYTVATLPAAGSAGRIAYVTDQLTACAVAGAALTGGGAVVCPVFDNGSAWVGE